MNQLDFVNPNRPDTEEPVLSFKEVDALIRKPRKNFDKFPTDVFPDSIQRYIKESSVKNAFDSSFIAGYLMSAVSTAAGQDISLFNGTWNTTSQLWLCILGNQGVSKSHPLKLSYEAIRDLNNEKYEDFKEELSRWQSGGSDEDKPVHSPLTTNDFSNEKLKEILCLTNKGVAIVKDELIGWVKDMTRYNNAGTVEQYLTYFDGGEVSSDTLGRGSLYSPKSCLNIVGSMQPEVLKDLFTGNNKGNGFLSRLLFIYPKNQDIGLYTGKVIDKEVAASYDDMIRWVYGLSERTLQVSQEVKELYIQWEQENIVPLEQGSLETELMMKLRTYSWRFAIILDLLRQYDTKTESTEISIESMKGALELVAYFKGQALRAHNRVHQEAHLNLPNKQRILFEALPEKFTKKQANEALSWIDAGEMVLRSLLSNELVIKKAGHGQYVKI
jgi:hypothetical protein